MQGFLLGKPRPADEVWLVLHEIDHGLMPFSPIGDGNGLDGRAGDSPGPAAATGNGCWR